MLRPGLARHIWALKVSRFWPHRPNWHYGFPFDLFFILFFWSRTRLAHIYESACQNSRWFIWRMPLKVQTSLLTYLLTPWCRVLLDKLTGLQLVKKFPAFHGTRRFITLFTSVRQLSLSWASPIQATYPHPTSWRSVLILSTHLRLGLPSGFFPSGFPTRPYTPPSPPLSSPHAQPISFFSILSPAQYWVRSIDHSAPRYAVSSIPLLPRPS